MGLFYAGLHSERQVCHLVVQRRYCVVAGGLGVAVAPGRDRGLVGAAGAGDGNTALLQVAPVPPPGTAPGGVTQRHGGTHTEGVEEGATP